ncbi:hypothetical protein [Aliivibrio fischeri]|uniref:hypothetical protein n=1 Tax=Aliivibrio fischeri TaxID=668 RepID=UPI001060C24F|nr:hypothetical protein [Aliivibrio fischeri]TDM51518.1 hypothetical protein VFFQA001_15500 [Aliivibrio fischeri]
MNKKFFTINENYNTTSFHFLESDIRTYELTYDKITSFQNTLKIQATDTINLKELKSIYRYADGLLINADIANTIAALDCYMTSLYPVILYDEINKVENYFYLKIYDIKNCINFEKSHYLNEGNIFSFEKIELNPNSIRELDRVFFADDEYSIIIDELIFNIICDEDIEISVVTLS